MLERVRGGAAVALVSDAGMPAVSDPGSSLVAAAVRGGLSVTPVPGGLPLLLVLLASFFFISYHQEWPLSDSCPWRVTSVAGLFRLVLQQATGLAKVDVKARRTGWATIACSGTAAVGSESGCTK